MSMNASENPRGTRLDARQIADYCERYYGAIFRYVAYRVNHRTDAEDLASEVFVRALESQTPVQVSALGVLYRIAENLIIDYYLRSANRKKGFEDGTAEELLLIADPGPGDLTGRIDLANSLKSLSGEQYLVVVMRFLEGYSIQDVAAALGKTPGAVKALQFRALVNLRNALGVRLHETT